MTADLNQGDSGSLPESFFAPAERASPGALALAIRRAVASPIIDTLLRSHAGMLAVLDPHRQIVALNAGYLRLLGERSPADALGLRPGEAVGCVHAGDHPGGCGTGRFCADCGAAIAIVTSLATEAPEDRECVLTIRQGEQELSLDLLVRAAPMLVDDQRFVLLFLDDISADKRRAALERTFLHDLSNLVLGLAVASESLESNSARADQESARDVVSLIKQLVLEISVQRALSEERPAGYRLAPRQLPVSQVLDVVARLAQHHPAARGRSLRLPERRELGSIETDPALLHRVLTNMLVNAFEATPAGGEVRFELTEDCSHIRFAVWNPGVMPDAVARRIFQRYFSTKPGDGRGQGTFAMKLFGEQYLRGQVGFASTADDGTSFWLRLPRRLDP